MEYSKFKVEEFVTDEHFVKWIKRPDAEANAFWNSWLSKNLPQLARVRKAREIVLHLEFKINRPPEGRLLELWEKIVRPEPERQRSEYDIKKGDIINSYRFRSWKLPIRKKMVHLFYQN
jgi:transmembrane sensor